jgi:hypothetical protein
MGQEHFGLASPFASESVSSSSAFRLRPASSSRAESASVGLNERNYVSKNDRGCTLSKSPWVLLRGHK